MWKCLTKLSWYIIPICTTFIAMLHVGASLLHNQSLHLNWPLLPDAVIDLLKCFKCKIYAQISRTPNCVLFYFWNDWLQNQIWLRPWHIYAIYQKDTINYRTFSSLTLNRSKWVRVSLTFQCLREDPRLRRFVAPDNAKECIVSQDFSLLPFKYISFVRVIRFITNWKYAFCIF